MPRTFGLLIATCLASSLMANAQSLSTLEVTSGTDAVPLEVSTAVPLVSDGIAQLTSDIAGTGDGVLLDLQQETVLAVSSQNASSAVDLVLISPSGNIAAIVRRAAPGSQNPIAFSGPVAAILQLTAGSADEAGLKPGGSVSHNILGNQVSNEE